MFSRDSAPLWSGNLKKFKRQQYTQSDGTVASKIVDKNGATAVNEKGEFTKTAYDFWGDAMSGQDVATGGAASQLPAPAARKLYTDVGTASDLTNADNKLDSSNSLITSTMLAGTYTTANSLMDFFGGEADGISCLGSYKDCNGGSHYVIGDPSTNAGCVNIKQVTTCPIAGSSITTEQRTQLLDFVRGVGIDGKPRKHMGDMLNSKPMVVDYGAAGQRIFAATNEGFLHSIDTTTGVEKWAFMPNSLLDNINTFYKNTPSEAHVYGIDGPLTIWNYDKNLDGKINAADGDKRVMFFGLRRGGNSYYAIDITSPDNPAILWKKENSLGIDDGTWNVLGETWSKPTLAKMRIGNASSSELRDVLVFGAGYDAAKDTEVARTADKLGRDVMIVDALTGELHWSLQRDVLNGFSGSDFDNPIPSNTNRLKDSVPGDIRVLDMDRNGALDRLYFADTGGNLWRVDMDHDVRDADTSMYDYKDAVLTKIASLGTDGNYGKDTRKFFYEPDVALIQNNGKVLMTIALGSGYRTHPLNTNTNDRFYVLMDPNVYNEPPADFAPIKNSDLINARAAIGATGGFKSADDSLLSTNYKGWYYAFSNTGEKVLAPAVTFLNKAVFTTFAPVDAAGAGPTGDPCDTPPNSARAYVLDLFTGRAVANLDRSADKSKDDSVVAGVNEILSAAQIVFRIPTASDGTTCTEGDCKQTVEIRVGKMNLPLMDDSNSDNANTGNSTSDIAGKTDLSGILPRIFWRDHDVSGGN
jgi:Tfp pilus tip-associated adhesin PilY1